MSTAAEEIIPLKEISSSITQAFLPAETECCFVHTVAQIAQSPLGQPIRGVGGPVWVDPVAFLTGQRASSQQFLPMVPPAQAGSLSLITAQYGMGKSELMRQLCRELHEENTSSGLYPIPVNLARCRAQAKTLENGVTNKETFLRLLFGHLGNVGEAVLQGRIQIPSGARILLILDGLDELVFSQRQHQNFVHGVALLLRDASLAHVPLHIALTVRYEYLVAFDFGTEISDQLRQVAGEKGQLHVLRLDFFTKDDMLSYYERRTNDEMPVVVSNHRKLMELLQRPLLLRIFCDYVQGRENKVFADLDSYAAPERLLWRYLRAMSHDRSLAPAQKQISGAHYRLDLKKLANVCLGLFKSYRESLSVDEVRSCLKPTSGDVPSEAPREEVWPSIHKCTFLRRHETTDPTGAEMLVFAHRSFFELLVARAMYRRIKDEDGLTEFDDFVLNVDMRKFLHAMLKGRWYARTFKSYGLANPEEWALLHPSGAVPDAASLRNLDKERKLLLDLMTDPERAGDGNAIVKSEGRFRVVRDFLLAVVYQPHRNPAGEGWLHEYHHPRYLLYNYEAVAVFLRYQWWDEHAPEVNTELNICLQQGVARVLERIIQRDERFSILQGPHELLLERMLDIGLRLRYGWVKKELARAKEQIRRDDLNARMSAIDSELSNIS